MSIGTASKQENVGNKRKIDYLDFFLNQDRHLKHFKGNLHMEIVYKFINYTLYYIIHLLYDS